MKCKSYNTFFETIGNKTRLNILEALQTKSMSVTEICAVLKEEQSKISHALKELRGCNIVKVEQKGKQRIYSLSKTIIPILRMIECHSKGCCAKCQGCL